MKTNIVNNRPLVEISKENENDSLRLQEKAHKGMELHDAIMSPDGQIIISRIEERLIQRIEQLMNSDLYCRSLLDVLNSLNITLSHARRAAERLVGQYKKSEEKE